MITSQDLKIDTNLATVALRNYLKCMDFYEDSVSKGHPEDLDYYSYLSSKVSFWEGILLRHS